MKKLFITGLVLLLPLAVTLAIITFIFNLLTEPFAGGVSQVLDYYDLLNKSFFIFSASKVRFFISQVLILIFLFFFTVLLGKIARYVFVHYFIRLGDYLFKKIPLINTIYKTSQDVINTIFTSNKNSFKQVVMIPFPHPTAFSIGLVTQDEIKGFSGVEDENLVAVFVPTTPNPTSGFLMLYPKKDLVYLDMKVEDAFKYVISCGVILNEFSVTDSSGNKIEFNNENELSPSFLNASL